MALLDALFRSPAIEEILSDRSRMQSMLDFEAALARAEASAGVIPAAAAKVIAAKCKADLLDLSALGQAATDAGNLAIPMVKQLTTLVAKDSADAARYVHWGATSQDAIDTGMVLQLREAAKRIDKDLEALADALAEISAKHAKTPVAGRTWMQQAIPTSFGFKTAGWLDAVGRHRARLRKTAEEALVLQFGGAVGTLASLGKKGPEVAAALARNLELPLPRMPWHSHRDRLGEIAATLGLLMGTLGKIAADIALHSQTEVQEVAEPASQVRGGSSSMPQKRNSVTAATVLASANRVAALVGAMLRCGVQEQERGMGGWHAEWELMPEIVGLTGGALYHLARLVPRLRVFPQRMKENLERTHGLIFAEAVSMALAKKMGKQAAHSLVEAACDRARAEGKHLRQILLADKEAIKALSETEIASLFDANLYLGSSEEMVDAVLAAHRELNLKNDRGNK